MRTNISKISLLAASFLALPVLLGMGMLGGEPTGRIPSTVTENIGATFVDSDGTEVRIERVNIDGEEALAGNLGKGLVLIPLARVTAVRFEGTGEDVRRAEVSLADGKQVSLDVDAFTEFSGTSEFGTYYVSVRDLRAIRFDPRSTGEATPNPPITASPPSNAAEVPGL